MDNLLKQFRPLDLMVSSTTMLGNRFSDLWLNSSQQIISFISDAFDFNEEMKNFATTMITKKLISVATINDMNYNYANPDLEMDEIMSYFNDIKLRNLLILQNKYNNRVNEWLNYQYYHYYQPYMHYQRINRIAKRGDLDACRHIGILEALGIGTEPNYEYAIQRLKQSTFWGDISSAYLLRQVYRIVENREKVRLMDEIIQLLEKYLNRGITIVKQENNYSEEAKTLYVLISSTYHDIVKHLKEQLIDYSFVEVMLIDKVSYNKKLEYITNYNSNKWKDESNSVTSPQTKLGFIKRD
ncbi:MAG: hypothetical protein PHX62_04435 [Bacilli bacterium]|nr:hypothetical protein [Bacilli bacterium]